jgi:hypothetical protein
MGGKLEPRLKAKSNVLSAAEPGSSVSLREAHTRGTLHKVLL